MTEERHYEEAIQLERSGTARTSVQSSDVSEYPGFDANGNPTTVKTDCEAGGKFQGQWDGSKWLIAPIPTKPRAPYPTPGATGFANGSLWWAAAFWAAQRSPPVFELGVPYVQPAGGCTSSSGSSSSSVPTIGVAVPTGLTKKGSNEFELQQVRDAPTGKWMSRPRPFAGTLSVSFNDREPHSGQPAPGETASLEFSWSLQPTCQFFGRASGPDWTRLYLPSKDPKDLDEPFRSHVLAFLAALERAGVPQVSKKAREKSGVGVTINTTYRPDERAWLMHHAWRIVFGKGRGRFSRETPTQVPDYPEGGFERLPICWVHPDQSGNPDMAASRRAAKEMEDEPKTGYGGNLAAYPSNHTRRNAIDMIIDWQGAIMVDDAKGKPQMVKTFADLERVAATYQIFHNQLPGEGQHWSSAPNGD